MGCVISGNGHRWPGGTIPFRISDDLSPDQQTAILSATTSWNELTVIRLVERTDEDDYVEFVAGDDCESKVGRQGGRQTVTCSFKSDVTVMHEIGHAVGMWHEQSRQDRDLFVVVHRENAQPGKEYNFDRHVDDGDAIESYDYESVMHYGPRGRAVDWRPGSEIEGQLGKAGAASAPGVALAPAVQGLHMVHLGDSSNDLWWSIFDGKVWRKADGIPGNARIPGQRSKATPALAARFGEIQMVHLGDTSNDLWWSMYEGSSWIKSDATPGNERIPGQRSTATPALVAYAYTVHMAHLGESSNDIWNSQLVGGEWVANRRRYRGQSKAGPAMAVSAGNLYMLHLGSDSNSVLHTVFDESQQTIVAPPGVTIGLQDHLSPGDIQAVAIAYR